NLIWIPFKVNMERRTSKEAMAATKTIATDLDAINLRHLTTLATLSKSLALPIVSTTKADPKAKILLRRAGYFIRLGATCSFPLLIRGYDVDGRTSRGGRKDFV